MVAQKTAAKGRGMASSEKWFLFLFVFLFLFFSLLFFFPLLLDCLRSIMNVFPLPFPFPLSFLFQPVTNALGPSGKLSGSRETNVGVAGQRVGNRNGGRQGKEA